MHFFCLPSCQGLKCTYSHNLFPGRDCEVAQLFSGVPGVRPPLHGTHGVLHGGDVHGGSQARGRLLRRPGALTGEPVALPPQHAGPGE